MRVKLKGSIPGRCPSCGHDHSCFNGLAIGSGFRCDFCKIRLRCVESSPDGSTPVFEGNVALTTVFEYYLRMCAIMPFYPETDHDKGLFQRLHRRGFVERCGDGFIATPEMADALLENA